MHAQPRKRAEWLDLVVMLEESGTKAREFSAQRGLNAKTLELEFARKRADPDALSGLALTPNV